MAIPASAFFLSSAFYIFLVNADPFLILFGVCVVFVIWPGYAKELYVRLVHLLRFSTRDFPSAVWTLGGEIWREFFVGRDGAPSGERPLTVDCYRFLGGVGEGLGQTMSEFSSCVKFMLGRVCAPPRPGQDEEEEEEEKNGEHDTPRTATPHRKGLLAREIVASVKVYLVYYVFALLLLALVEVVVPQTWKLVVGSLPRTAATLFWGVCGDTCVDHEGWLWNGYEDFRGTAPRRQKFRYTVDGQVVEI